MKSCLHSYNRAPQSANALLAHILSATRSNGFNSAIAHSNHDGKIAWVCFAPGGKSCKTLSQDDAIVQQAILALKNPMSSDDISGDRRISDLEIPLHEQTNMKTHGCESADPALWLDFVNDWDKL